MPATEREPDEAFSGRFTGTRRNFIRGVAAAGASTVLASSLQRAGVLDLFAETAQAADPTHFSEFTAIAASGRDAFQVPEGFRADIVMSYGDKFSDDKGNEFTYGHQNDFLAFFPLGDGSTEGVLFVNHEYTSPFYLHGYKANQPGGKSRAEIDMERATIGNSIVHIKRNAEGVWKPVSPSKYNRRIYAGLVPGEPATEYSVFEVTGPLVADPKVGATIEGTLGNCSGGTTPWGTAISCEENFDGYGLPLPSTQDFVMGWADPTNDGFPGYPQYLPDAPYRNSPPGFRKYGWVCEHDPYDPTFVPRKHTALGRFRHENTSFRHVPGKQFVIYMGDDQNNDCVYKFVSDREYLPGDRAHNLQILQAGTLYVARWEPEGRRRFGAQGQTEPVTPESGTGTWEAIPVEGLSDTRNYLADLYGSRTSTTSEYGLHYATNRPEDVEVGPDGEIYVALTNNTTGPSGGDPGINDSYGSVRKIVEEENDPTALSFVWTEYAAGGPSSAGATGFDSPDNLVFDSQENLWVMTDISTGSIGTGVHAFHANNGVYMVPTKGPNAGVAFRFANLPIQAEGTGPYFTPDESTLFINVQHPGEQAGIPDGPNNPAVYGDPSTYPSYWPRGNKSDNQNPSEPLPSMVAISRVRAAGPGGGGGTPVIPPPATGGGGTPPPGRNDNPEISLLSPRRQSLGRFIREGMRFRIRVDEPATLRVTVYGRLTNRRRNASASVPRGKLRRMARRSVRVDEPGTITVRLRPRAALRLLLRREDRMPGLLSVRAVDTTGKPTTRTKTLLFK